MAMKVPRVKLNNGLEIPVFGLGTWRSDTGKVTQAVKDAIDVGYRHIDGAFVYGNEAEVGAGIRAKIEEGVVKREDIFVTSKLWNTFHRRDLVIPACKKTLELLGLEYLDLYLIHWPMAYKEEGAYFPRDADGNFIFSDVDYIDTWKEMEKLVRMGLCRSIGLSNFNSKQVQRVIDMAEIKPVMLQVECHPYFNQKKLIEFCQQRGVVVTAYSPLGSPDNPMIKPNDAKVLDNPKFPELGKKYGKTPAQIILRFLVQHGVVVIPKSVTKSRIEQNIQIFDFELTPEDMASIESLNSTTRYCSLTWVSKHPHYPFLIEY